MTYADWPIGARVRVCRPMRDRDRQLRERLIGMHGELLDRDMRMQTGHVLLDEQVPGYRGRYWWFSLDEIEVIRPQDNRGVVA